MNFGQGFTVLTGETGAGKSIIFGSLNLMLGGRAFTDSIRSGEENASVEAVFSADKATCSILQEMGIECCDEIIFRRNISAAGQNKCYINNCSSTLSAMNKAASSLFDIHGQHQHQTLLDPARHLDFVDIYIGGEELRSEVSCLYSEIRTLEQQLEKLNENEMERARRTDLLKFQIDEIRKSGFRNGDEEKLEAEKNILVNAERFNSLVSESLEILHESDRSVLSYLKTLNTNLSKLSDIDSEFSGLTKAISSSVYSLEDVLFALRNRSEAVEFSPEKLEDVETSLSRIANLKRKYGNNLSDVLAHAEKCEEELNAIEDRDNLAEHSKDELENLYRTFEEKASILSGERKAASEQLKKAVEKELAELSFSGASFSIRFSFKEDGNSRVLADGIPVRFSETGFDSVEFYISPNVGEDEKPLARTASGGELSRIMLALKTVILEKDDSKTLVFDEVDSGIGGKEAETVGEKLKNLSRLHQVICITHLPQIASFADFHLRIRKEERDGRTFTEVAELGYNERVTELARMLGGKEISETAVMHAGEMLKTERGNKHCRTK